MCSSHLDQYLFDDTVQSKKYMLSIQMFCHMLDEINQVDIYNFLILA